MGAGILFFVNADGDPLSIAGLQGLRLEEPNVMEDC